MTTPISSPMTAPRFQGLEKLTTPYRVLGVYQGVRLAESLDGEVGSEFLYGITRSLEDMPAPFLRKMARDKQDIVVSDYLHRSLPEAKRYERQVAMYLPDSQNIHFPEWRVTLSGSGFSRLFSKKQPPARQVSWQEAFGALRHEVGHAMAHRGRKELSDHRGFVKAYRRDLSRLSAEQVRELSYYHPSGLRTDLPAWVRLLPLLPFGERMQRNGKELMARGECFAEVFASMLGGGCGDSVKIQRAFPEATRWIHRKVFAPASVQPILYIQG